MIQYAMLLTTFLMDSLQNSNEISLIFFDFFLLFLIFTTKAITHGKSDKEKLGFIYFTCPQMNR